jgi:hypothetical protein
MSRNQGSYDERMNGSTLREGYCRQMQDLTMPVVESGLFSFEVI